MAETATMLKRFIERIRAEAQTGASPGRVQAILRESLQTVDDWLDPSCQQPRDGAYTQYVLFQALDGTCSVVSLVICPGEALPLQNHGAWAVVGVYKGQERETWFRRLDDGGMPGRAQLVVERTFVHQRGTVSVVPDGQIHTVEAFGDEPAISIHVYGTDIVTQPRSTFDLEAGSEKMVRPRYVELPADGEA